MCSQLYFFLLFNCRCSYLKDDNVGYFAVHTMAGKKQFIVTMIFDVCAVLDETWHSRVMAWWCKLVAVIFNIWSRLDLIASQYRVPIDSCTVVLCKVMPVLYLKDDDVGYFAVNTVQVKIFYLTMHDYSMLCYFRQSATWSSNDRWYQ